MSTRLSRVETQRKRRNEEKSEKKHWKQLWHYLGTTTNKFNSDVMSETQLEEPIVSESDIVPSRLDTYHSSNVKISRIFQNTLIFLFVVLTVALVLWGLEGAPPMKEMWK
ncbi:hypothetical protein [Paenibacillus sp. CMAA1364]